MLKRTKDLFALFGLLLLAVLMDDPPEDPPARLHW
jgi:hypothetical protein